ncbi:MAG: ATP-dependent RecD-like DNA helicase [Pseudomonadales bacterium]|nr:ATP-dependent RecD-like DNA helicase [Pseudomonadales bacterium]
METIEGTIRHVRTQRPDTGWALFEVEIEHQCITAVGLMPPLDEGLSCVLGGVWNEHPTFGRQFKIVEGRALPPVSTLGVERFLQSGAIEGIGKKYANLIVNKFGDNTLDILENKPWQLKYLKGIGPKRRAAISQGLKTYRSRLEVMSFLFTKLGPARTQQVYEKYGDNAKDLISQNPYRLIRDFAGFGFAIADAMAKQVGVVESSSLRLNAAVLHVLNQQASLGHTCVERTACQKEVAKLLGNPELAVLAIARLAESEDLIEANLDGLSVVQTNRFQSLERSAAKWLLALRDTAPAVSTIDAEKAIPWAEERASIEFDESQKRAISLALREKVCVVTGGPGVGKTTIINALLTMWRAKRYDIALAAPTGRAARRMSEATRDKALTIHKLLESGGAGRFARNQKNPLQEKIIVIDETSMVDLWLFNALLEALPGDARLILVGDKDQLPSVGAGQVLADIIESGILPVARLEKPFRQAAGSSIVVNAHLVNAGEVPDLGTDKGEFCFHPTDDALSTREEIIETVCKRVVEDGYEPMSDVMVLIPMHKGKVGVGQMNEELQHRLNPKGKVVADVGDHELRINDRVIQTRNNSDLEVSNGDIGQILLVTPGGDISVSFDGRIVSYATSQVSELALAYAITIHKSQGSEYPAVVLAVDTSESILLSRQLLYTAITRGKRAVHIVGQRRGVHIAVSEARAHKRLTRLTEQIESLIKA